MMEALSACVILVGLGLMLVGAVWFLIAAFQESILWGLGVLFIPLVSLAFLIVEWPAAKRPFLWQLAGFAFVIAGVTVASGHLPYERHHHIHLW
jgi:hypothetical protein